jgi:hypothetical protein
VRMLFHKQHDERKSVVFNVFVVGAVVPANISDVLNGITQWISTRYDIKIIWSDPNILDVPHSNGDARDYIMGAQFYRDMFFKVPIGNTIVLLPEVYRTMGTIWVPPCVYVSSLGVAPDDIAKSIVSEYLAILRNKRGGDDVDSHGELINQSFVEHTMLAGMTYCFSWKGKTSRILV